MMSQSNSTQEIDSVLQRLEELVGRIEKGSDPQKSEKDNKYRDALKDAVRTLEATKQAFKSKQLKELRERIESILNEE